MRSTILCRGSYLGSPKWVALRFVRRRPPPPRDPSLRTSPSGKSVRKPACIFLTSDAGVSRAEPLWSPRCRKSSRSYGQVVHSRPATHGCLQRLDWSADDSIERQPRQPTEPTRLLKVSRQLGIDV